MLQVHLDSGATSGPGSRGVETRHKVIDSLHTPSRGCQRGWEPVRPNTRLPDIGLCEGVWRYGRVACLGMKSTVSAFGK